LQAFQFPSTNPARRTAGGHLTLRQLIKETTRSSAKPQPLRRAPRKSSRAAPQPQLGTCTRSRCSRCYRTPFPCIICLIFPIDSSFIGLLSRAPILSGALRAGRGSLFAASISCCLFHASDLR
jgi:hypothetical protein